MGTLGDHGSILRPGAHKSPGSFRRDEDRTAPPRRGTPSHGDCHGDFASPCDPISQYCPSQFPLGYRRYGEGKLQPHGERTAPTNISRCMQRKPSPLACTSTKSQSTPCLSRDDARHVGQKRVAQRMNTYCTGENFPIRALQLCENRFQCRDYTRKTEEGLTPASFPTHGHIQDVLRGVWGSRRTHTLQLPGRC